MSDVEMIEFDDELQTMRELMKDDTIKLSDDSLKKPIQSLNFKKAVIVSPDTSVRDCIRSLIARKIGCLLIVNDKKQLSGIFTERDVLNKVAGNMIDLENTRIEELMTRDPKPLMMNDTIQDALNLMHHGGYRHISVVDSKKRPVAVVSIRDIIRFICDFFPESVLNLPPHPIRVGTKNREGG